MRRPSIRRTSTPKLVLLMAVAVGCLVWLVGDTIARAADQYESAGWPSTQGVVTRCDWAWRKLFRRRLLFTCAFEVEGREYKIRHPRRLERSVRYWFGGVRRFVEAHPPGSTMTVWYDPADAARATTGRGLSAVELIPDIAIGIGLLGAACLAAVELIGRAHDRTASADMPGGDG